MLTKGHKIIIIIIAALFAIALIVYILVQSVRGPSQPSAPESAEPVEVSPAKALSYSMPELTDQEAQRQTIQNLAMVFTERFGTFSNHNNFSQLDELAPMMSEQFAAWAQTVYRRQLTRDFPAHNGYLSVRTEALAVNFESYTADSAVVIVSAQQTKSNGGQPLEFKKDLKLEFIRSAGGWVVNGAYWQAS